MKTKLRYENITKNINSDWVNFYKSIYYTPHADNDLLLIRVHKHGQPELIDSINGDLFGVARQAFEAIHNKKFRSGYMIIKNALAGEWFNALGIKKG